jgi:hypothetical protein
MMSGFVPDPDMPGFAHRDGVWWHDAPLPPRWHRCQPWSRGVTPSFTRVERCACGATRLDGGPWLERNQTRKNRRAS